MRSPWLVISINRPPVALRCPQFRVPCDVNAASAAAAAAAAVDVADHSDYDCSSGSGSVVFFVVVRLLLEQELWQPDVLLPPSS